MPAPAVPRTGDPLRARWGAELIAWIMREVMPKGDRTTTKVSRYGVISAFPSDRPNDLFVYAGDFAVSDTSPETAEGSEAVYRATVAKGRIISGAEYQDTDPTVLELTPQPAPRYINLYLDINEANGEESYRIEQEDEEPTPPAVGDAWILAEIRFTIAAEDSPDTTTFAIIQRQFGRAEMTGRFT